MMLTVIIRRRQSYLLRKLLWSCCCRRNAATGTTATASEKSAPVLENWDRGGRTEKTSLSPLYNSVKKLIDTNPSCVSLIQVGSFYELYFDQASEYAPKLGLKLSLKKTTNHIIPFAGFPTSQLKRFTEMLINEQKVNVAIVDQCARGSKTDLQLVHRKISRIVTPGTLIDESFLNFNENNYLLSIYIPPNSTKLPPDPDMKIGLSWIDISVGDSFVQETTLGLLNSDLSRINPSEVLISKEFQDDNLHLGNWYVPLQDLRRYLLRYHTVSTYGELKEQFESDIQKVRRHFEDFSVREKAAMNMILSYISLNLPDSKVVLGLPTRYYNEDSLQMDARTREALELTERAIVGRTSAVGSLLSTIKRTCTSSGTRMLTEWIKSPLLDIEQIQYRQKYVNLFLKNDFLKMVTRQQLLHIGDFIRNLQRMAVGRGDVATQLIEVATSLEKLQKLKDFLTEEYLKNSQQLSVLQEFLDKFKVPKEISNEIFSTIHTEEISDEEDLLEESSSDSQEEVQVETNLGSYGNDFSEKYRVKQSVASGLGAFYSVRKDHSEVLISMHTDLQELENREQQYLDQLRSIVDKVDLKLVLCKKDLIGRYTHPILISGKTSSIEKIAEKLHDSLIYKKKASVLYRTKEWRGIQQAIDEKKSSILAVEEEIMNELKEKVTLRFLEFRELAQLVDFLDVTVSFAIVAEENDWTCPKLIKAPRLSIEGGRHVVVESSLKQSGSMFIPNDSKMGVDGNLWVISGPNMGGKSTYLRQNALIVILAQIGSYVPADRVTVGIVDRIFTRIGASDDLYNDLSTFMVEMVETSNILKHATTRSLAIVDEIGRGTSGKEGLAIAYATLVSLLKTNKCRTLFATHFGKELEQLLIANNIDQSKIRYYRTKVLMKDANGNDQFIIDHSLEPGISERSHALQVAKMAGFPTDSLLIAENVLNSL